jgi:hypothetical protein
MYWKNGTRTMQRERATAMWCVLAASRARGREGESLS